MTVALHREGFGVNHKRVYRLMRKLGIQSVIRKRRRYLGKSGSTVFPNLLERDFKAQLHYKKLATDITYLPTTSGFVYLSVVQDLCNNEVVENALSSRNDFALVFATLGKPPEMPGAVVHSDQSFNTLTSRIITRLKSFISKEAIRGKVTAWIMHALSHSSHI